MTSQLLNFVLSRNVNNVGVVSAKGCGHALQSHATPPVWKPISTPWPRADHFLDNNDHKNENTKVQTHGTIHVVSTK